VATSAFRGKNFFLIATRVGLYRNCGPKFNLIYYVNLYVNYYVNKKLHFPSHLLDTAGRLKIMIFKHFGTDKNIYDIFLRLKSFFVIKMFYFH
jgi:hypothetical protein